jgi:hypothetical protein
MSLLPRGRSRARILILIACLVVAMLALSRGLGNAQARDARRPGDAAAAQDDYTGHVAYIKEHGHAPTDYILDLFDSYDLVVLCERTHPEYTQWQLIYDVVRDRRFGQKVGHLFTEYGSVSAQAALDEFMAQPLLTPEQINARVRALMRRMTVWPLVDQANFYDFQRKLYTLNRSLSAARRTALYYSDIPFEWEGMTEERYRALSNATFRDRDKIMAERIIAAFREITAKEPRKKALVVLNYRHAMGNLERADGSRTNNATGFLMEAFPGRVANVLLHTVSPGAGRLIADGKWDAAFRLAGNRPAACSLAGSPFGRDAFDLWDLAMADRYRYEDVFTGYVFDGPLRAHTIVNGFPGMLDGFESEVLERSKALGADYHRRMKEEILPRLKAKPVDRRPAAYAQPSDETTNEWLSGARQERLRAAAETFAPYVGRYELTPKVMLIVTVADGRLVGELMGRGKFELTPDTPGKFLISRDADVWVRFDRDEDGEVTSAVFHQKTDVVGRKVK